MSGLGLLKFLSSLRGGQGLDRAVAIAERVMRLDLRRKVRTFSTGMKQKLALAQAFADPVEILILDEPTSALDPSARADVLNLVTEARQGRPDRDLLRPRPLRGRAGLRPGRHHEARGGSMHVEDMHDRQGLRMLLLKYEGDPPESFPEELELTLRNRHGGVDLVEHRGEVGPLLGWLQASRGGRPGDRDRGPQDPVRQVPRPRRARLGRGGLPVMSVVLTLVRKNLLDSRWLLAICGSALFGLCWLFVFVAHRIEVAIQAATGRPADGDAPRAGRLVDGLLDGRDRDGVLEPPVRPADLLDLGDRPGFDRRGRRDREGDDGPGAVQAGRPLGLPGLAGDHRRGGSGPDGRRRWWPATWWGAITTP